MPLKQYVLLESMNVTVPIFQRVNKEQRVPIVKREGYAPFLQVTCYNKDGVSKNIRYKEVCPTVDMAEQVEKYKIPANEKYTNSERNDRFFRRGVCMTNKVNLQNYLETYPGFEGSEWVAEEVPNKEYTIYDKSNLTKVQNAETRKRLLVGNKIMGLSLDEARSMLIRLNGSFFETPNTGDEEADLEECQNMLMDFADAAEDGGLDAILKPDEKITVDEQTTILIGKLINAGSLSFDVVEGKVSKKGTDGKWIELRDFSTEYSIEERKRLFSNFLNTSDGKPLKNDLEKDLIGLSNFQQLADQMPVGQVEPATVSDDLVKVESEAIHQKTEAPVKREYKKKTKKKKYNYPKKTIQGQGTETINES